jgi:hypothetical protein
VVSFFGRSRAVIASVGIRTNKLITDRCSLNTVVLPARLHNTRNLALERQRPETQAAYAELAQETPWPPAELAPVVLAGAELGLPRVFYPFCRSCHFSSSTRADSYQLSAFSSSLARRRFTPMEQTQTCFAPDASSASVKLTAES